MWVRRAEGLVWKQVRRHAAKCHLSPTHFIINCSHSFALFFSLLFLLFHHKQLLWQQSICIFRPDGNSLICLLCIHESEWSKLQARRVWSTCCFLYHLNSTTVTLQDRAWKQPQRRWAIFILKSGGIGQDKGGRGGDLSSSSDFQSYLQWIDWPHVMGKGELAQSVQFQTVFFSLLQLKGLVSWHIRRTI